ncbi:hypothetical protein ACPPVT_12075 [Angustibacter sp. McL0619]|uniref:hypothetical protein n=1 Tax=Angustibacter sp. McL0619 TaxID=3415676 RepID=UPI003CEB2D6A
MSEVAYSVVPDALELEAQVAERAADAVRDLRGHPGVLRGRARECGDDELGDALIAMAAAWDETLGDLAGEATRWQVLLRMAADTYRAAEAGAVPSGPASWLAQR